MKNFIILLAISFLIITSCENEKKRPSGNPSEVLNIETYNKLQQKYEKIFRFQEGTAIVLKNNLYGLINEKGKEILPCSYDSISSFLKHFRIIKKDKKYGVLNNYGDVIKPCVYSDFLTKEKFTGDRLCDYLALKLNDKWGFVDKEGNDVTQYKYEDIFSYDDSVFIAKYDGYYGVSDYQNNTIIPYLYDMILYKMSYNYPITLVKQNNRFGLYNSKNKEVLPCEFDWINGNDYGYITVRKTVSNSTNSERYALIEAETGKIILPFDYIDMGEYSEGLVACENLDGKYGFLDLEGNIVIPFIYDDAGAFSEGLAPVFKADGYINTILGRMTSYKCGYIDKKGNVVIPFKFIGFNSASELVFHEGLAKQCVRNNKTANYHYGYIDTKGNWAIEPIFDNAEDFENGVAEVAINDKYGYINKNGDIIIPCIYDKYGGFVIDDSIIEVKKDGVNYYFNFSGKPINSPF